MKNLDPYNLKPRIARQLSKELQRIEEGGEVTTDDLRRISACLMMTRNEYVNMRLRGEKQDDEHVGSSVRKYTPAFAANAARKRAANAGPTEPDELDLELDDEDDGGNAA